MVGKPSEWSRFYRLELSKNKNRDLFPTGGTACPADGTAYPTGWHKADIAECTVMSAFGGKADTRKQKVCF